VISIQREPVSAVSSDINFPMKGRRGMKDWARSSEDKLFIPREVLSLASAGEAAPGHACVRTRVRLGLCGAGTRVSAWLLLCARVPVCEGAHLGVHLWCCARV